MEFKEIDVTAMEDARGEIGSMTGGAFATPTVVIGEEARVGFHPEWMRDRLGLGGGE